MTNALELARTRVPDVVRSVSIPEPYLHDDYNRIYNPLTDRTLLSGEPGFALLRAVLDGSLSVEAVESPLRDALVSNGWLIPDPQATSDRFRLMYVSLEAHTVCNQECWFCPVSTDPRKAYFMPTEFHEAIVGQLAAHRETIQAVFLLSYNEPTVDTRFVEQIRTLIEHGLPPAVNTNATGLTPKRVDALLEMGGLRYLSVNLSTLSASRYERDRGKDHLDLVLRNLDYVKDRPLAQRMEIAVLGNGNLRHRFEYARIKRRFSGSRFTVKFFRVMDRAGRLPVGLKPPASDVRLCGCENTGSRPLQHLHVTPHGICVLCCQDYDARHVVGDLTKQTVDEVLRSPEMATARKWAYGLEESPSDFLCRKCVFARTRAR